MPQQGSLNLRTGVLPREDAGIRAALVDPTERRLILADVDAPTPGPGQLLVAVRAAGLNRADLAVIAGTYHGTAATHASSPAASWPARSSPLVVQSPGGRRVIASWRWGAATPSRRWSTRRLRHGRPGLGWAAAGALPVAVATMHDALVTNGGLRAGHHVVVNAATSGVGVVAVRIALHLGAATVIGTSRSADKRAELAALVADDRFTVVAPDELVEAAGASPAGAAST